MGCDKATVRMAESSNYAKQNRVFERVMVAFQRGVKSLARRDAAPQASSSGAARLIQPTPEPYFDAPGIEQLAVKIPIGQSVVLPGPETIHVQYYLQTFTYEFDMPADPIKRHARGRRPHFRRQRSSDQHSFSPGQGSGLNLTPLLLQPLRPLSPADAG